MNAITRGLWWLFRRLALLISFASFSAAVESAVIFPFIEYSYPLPETAAHPNGGVVTYDLHHIPFTGGAVGVGKRTGMIRVPAGQQKLVIEVLGNVSVDCREQLYVARNRQLVLAYDVFATVVGTGGGGTSGASQFDYQSAVWIPGSAVVIHQPPAGDYYFAPWRSSQFNSDCPVKYSIRATYYPYPPSNLRITPTQQESDLGASAAIVLTARGQVNSYRWQRRRDGSTTWLSSAQNASAATAALHLPNLSATDDAEYRAIICNSGGCATSAWSRVVVRIPPSITSQPASTKAMPGNSVVFSVTAAGTSPLTYQWQHRDLSGNVRNLSGATSSNLTLSGVTFGPRAGAYRVLVMNPANPAGVISQWAPLTVGPQFIGLAPTQPSVTEGDSVSVTASALGTAPLVYNWHHDGQLWQSGFSPTLSLGTTREQDDGSWRLDVTNLAGKVSQTFTLEIIPPPTPPNFIVSPASVALTEGETLTLNSRTLGTRPISYHWFHNGNPAGSGTPLQITNVGPEHAGQWQVRATNSLGHDQSAPATVSVSPGPKILRQPVGAEVSPGSTVTLSIEAIGRAPVGYGWFKNGQPLGVSGPELMLNNVSPADSGFYVARVTNGLGQVLASQPARLLVQVGAVPPGTLLWKFPSPQPSQIVLHDDGRLVFMDSEGLKSLDEHGVLEWTFPRTSGPDSGFKQLLAAPGGVSIVNGNFQPISSNRVFAFGPQGQVLWSAISTNTPPEVVFDPRYPRTEVVERDDVTQIALGANGELFVARVYAWRYSNIYAGPDGLHLGLYALTQDEAFTGSLERPLRISKFPRTYHVGGISFSLAIDQNEEVRFAQHGMVTATFSPQGILGLPYSTTVHFGAVDGGIPFDVWESRLAFGWHVVRSRYSAHNAYIARSLWERSWLTRSGNFYGHHWSDPTVHAIGMSAEAYIGSGSSGAFLPKGALYRFRHVHGGTGDFWYQQVRKPFRSEIGGGYPVLNRANEVVRPVLHEFSHNVQGLAKDRLDAPSVAVRLAPERVWYYGPIRTTAALADDGTTYGVGWFTNTTSLHALNSEGQNSWEFVTAVETNGVIGTEENSPTIGADGTIYFPGGDAVYAIKGSSPIMDSSWPLYGGNVRRTWRAQELPKVPELALTSQFMVRGAAMTLNGESTGPQPMRYQWLKDGERLSGETNATLAVSDLRGFDSGRYQVRVSNPTGDRLSQLAQLKVVFDPTPFVDVVRTPEAAFTNVPPSANTRRDDWQFYHGINETNRTARYARLSPFLDPWQTPGLVAWAALSSTAAIGFNTSAAPLTTQGASVPSGRVFLNPGTNALNCVGLAWQAEVAGYYAVTGRLSRLAVDASGDGVRWHLDVGTLNILSGALPNSGTDTNLALAGFYLNRGERLHIILSPGDNDAGDLTGVELEVRLTEPDPNSEPGFLQSPQNVAVLAGQNAAFSALVAGSPEPALQWQRSLNNGATWESLFEGSEFAGVNSTNLEVFATTLEMNGHLFRVEAINAAGSAVSGAARLTVTDGSVAPSFFAQPQAVVTISGGLVMLSAQAGGTGPLSYQWYRDGSLLGGQTGATLTLNAAALSDAGSYYVVAANALGSQTSAVAIVTVDVPPAPPVLGLAANDSGVQVSLKGQSGSPWRIWRASSLSGPWEPLTEATVPAPSFGSVAKSFGELTVFDAYPPPDAAFYLAQLALPPTAPVITAQPLVAATFHEGGEGFLSIVVESAGQLSFQWWHDGVALPGATNQTFYLSGVTTNSAGSYFVVAGNAYGAVTSQVAVVTIGPPPFIDRIANVLATATSELSQFGRYASNAVNGVKLDPYFWQTTSLVPLDRAPAITFDLQGIYRLDQMLFWNCHERAPIAEPGVKRMRIGYSRDGINFEHFAEVEPGPGTGTEEPSDAFALDRLEARFIRFEILENYDGQQFPYAGSATNYPLVAIDEVEFYGEFLAPIAPEITVQPNGMTNCLAGIALTLNAAAIGTQPLTYHWWLEGNPISDATNHTLTISSLTPAHEGRYTLIVSNAGGEVVSSPALVTVTTNANVLSVPTEGLLVYLPLNNSTNDASGHGRHARDLGTVQTRDRFGILGGANGQIFPQRLQLPGLDPDDYSSGFSFGGWVLVTNEQTSYPFFWPIDGAGGSFTYLLLGGEGAVGFGSGGFHRSVGGVNAPIGQWNHWMVTHGAAVDRLYVNGSLLDEWPAQPLQNNAPLLELGWDFRGTIDDVTVFSRELTPAEVQTLAAQ